MQNARRSCFECQFHGNVSLSIVYDNKGLGTLYIKTYIEYVLIMNFVSMASLAHTLFHQSKGNFTTTTNTILTQIFRK